MNEFCITGTKISKIFSVESCVKFKSYLLKKLSEYEDTIFEDYKNENKLEQMTIFCNSGAISESKIKILDRLWEDIWSISHYSQTLLFILNFVSPISVAGTACEQNILKNTQNDLKTAESMHNNIVQEILGAYITFEKPLLQSMLKGILEKDDRYVMDELKSKYEKEAIIKTDLIVQVFLVYEKWAIRAMYTLNMSTAWAVVNTILSSLNEDIIRYLNHKISSYLAKAKKVKGVSTLLNFALRGTEEQCAGFWAKFTLYNSCLINYLNAYHTCIHKIEKLREQLVYELDTLLEETEVTLEDFKKGFPHPAGKD